MEFAAQASRFLSFNIHLVVRFLSDKVDLQGDRGELEPMQDNRIHLQAAAISTCSLFINRYRQAESYRWFRISESSRC